jgi:hypothetical protein
MKLHRLLFTLILSAVFVTGTYADEKKAIKGFSGGMMVHSGYQYGGDNPYNLDISSPTFGIGGCAKLHLSNHFRAGFEGYFSTAPINSVVQSGSHNKMFWTGVLADWYWQKGKVIPYVGATIGGGMETSFYMFEGNKHDWELPQKSVLHKQPFFAVDPYVGVEYAVGEALRLTLKADWLLAINSDGLNRPMGPRIYFGFIFAH